ncbi:MAG: hypothetical protein PVJ28_05240 [Acidimicrobiia bacterium]
MRTYQKEVMVLSNPTYECTALIDAPVHSVFEYCLDPRGIYVGDPMMKVVDATLTPEGVGTEAKLEAKMPLFTETVALEYTDVIPDQRIVFQSDPTMTFLGRGRPISIPVHIFTLTFEPERGGTRLDLVVEEQNPPRWYRILDRIFDKSSKKMINDRLARLKAAAQEQATKVS